jgi:cysteine desulfurase
MEHLNMERVYLDHAATTKPDQRVLEAMWSVYKDDWGNPSSIYLEGQQARRWIDQSRDRCAGLLDVNSEEIIFTSGGTESDNAAIRGAAFAQRELGRGSHIVTTQIEHHAVLHTAEQLENEGFEVTYLPVDNMGIVDLDTLESSIRDDTILLSLMLANNEVGSLQPVNSAAQIARRKNPDIVIHSDAVQAVGAVDVSPKIIGVDLLTLAGHKFYGPKGVGLLYVRQGTPWSPFVLGGGQEKERRGGTENVAGVVGFAVAFDLVLRDARGKNESIGRLRDRLINEIPERIPDTVITGPLDSSLRLPNNFSCCFRNVEGESVLLSLDMVEIAASSGSACTTGALEPSHVLTAMGVDADLAHASLRLSLGVATTNDEVDYVIEKLPPIINRLRQLAPDPI